MPFLLPIRWPYLGGAPDSAIIFADLVFPFLIIFSIIFGEYKKRKFQVYPLDIAVITFFLYTMINGGFNINTGSSLAAFRQIYLLGIFIFFSFCFGEFLRLKQIFVYTEYLFFKKKRIFKFLIKIKNFFFKLNEKWNKYEK